MELICEAGHRRKEHKHGKRCGVRLADKEGRSIHAWCKEKVIDEPTPQRCWYCDRGIVVNRYCCACGSPHPAVDPGGYCCLCGVPKSRHSGLLHGFSPGAPPLMSAPGNPEVPPVREPLKSDLSMASDQGKCVLTNAESWPPRQDSELAA